MSFCYTAYLRGLAVAKQKWLPTGGEIEEAEVYPCGQASRKEDLLPPNL
jgi:SLT domain-containing protein